MSFTKLKSSCIPMPLEQVEIKQILPTRFLENKYDLNLGEKLFYDWRYDRDGRLNTSFVLNNPIYSGSILLTGNDFGKGLSEESAILSLLDYGFKALISYSFAADFKNTALQFGLIPIEVPESLVNDLMIAVHTNPSLTILLDLETQLLEVPDLNLVHKFKLNPYQLLCQMYG